MHPDRRRTTHAAASSIAAVAPSADAPAVVRLHEASGRWVLARGGPRLGDGDARRHRRQRRPARASARTSAPGSPGCSGSSTATRSPWPRSSCSAASLGDRFGRRRVFVIGTSGSRPRRCCAALAPTVEVLVAARALQGVGGALLTPGSLAIIAGRLPPRRPAKAIGAWSGLGGIAGAVGPFLGGWLVECRRLALGVLHQPARSPRSSCFVARAARPGDPRPEREHGARPRRRRARRARPGGRHLRAHRRPRARRDRRHRRALRALGSSALVAFVRRRARSRHPMLPLGSSRRAQFTAANAVTFVVYAALGGVFFLLVVNLQVVGRLLAARGGRRVAADHRPDADPLGPAGALAAADRPARAA